jgi:hypothetical protein
MFHFLLKIWGLTVRVWLLFLGLDRTFYVGASPLSSLPAVLAIEEED